MDIRSEIIRLTGSKVYQRLSDYYAKRSVFDILGIERREEAHSHFIAWLFDPSENHGCGSYALFRFLQCLAKSRIDFRELNKCATLWGLDDVFVTGNYKMIGDVGVETEVSLSSGRASGKQRIDILVLARLQFDGKEKCLPIIIENKVKSQEHDNQTLVYYKWAVDKYKDESKYWKPIFVFLTPDATLDLKEAHGRDCCCEAFVKTNYQYFVNFVIEPTLRRMDGGPGKSLVNDYLRCLSCTRTINIEKGKGKEKFVMAINSEERELLRMFWKQNQALLKVAMEALSEDEEFSETERKTFKKGANALDGKKDYSRYRLDGGEERFSKRGIVEAVVTSYLNKHPRTTLQEFSEKFPGALHAGGFSRPATGNYNKSRYYEPMTLSDGSKIIVSNQWGIGNIDQFLENAKKLGFQIEIS